jgi:hypothetical protein
MRRTLLLVPILGCCPLLFGQEASKAARAWLDAVQEPATVNVTGVWYGGPDWGRITLTQKEGGRSVVGTGGGYDIAGVVSGTDVYLVFFRKGRETQSAKLAAEGPTRLTGGYVWGLLDSSSKTRPMSLSLLNAGQPAAAAKGDSSSGLNVDGTWVSHDWGRMKLVQAAGKREFTGRSRAYEIDGVVSESKVVLHFRSKGKLEYSAELAPKGIDTLSGRYASGEMRDDSTTKPTELCRAGSGGVDEGPYMRGVYWLKSHSEPPAINVSGTWEEKTWKTVVLRQKEGSSSVSGTGDSWNIHGVVSGTKVYLLFTSLGGVAYSAVLTMDGDKTLKGSYASEVMRDESKGRPMVLTKTGPARLMPPDYKATSAQTIEVTDFAFPDGADFGLDYQAALSDELVRRFVKLRRFAEVRQAGYSAPDAKAPDLRVTGVVTAVNEGNRAVRVLVGGMGAGRAYIRAHVKFIDVAAGNVKLEQDVEGDMYTGSFGGEPIYAVTSLAKEIANLAKSKGLR